MRINGNLVFQPDVTNGVGTEVQNFYVEKKTGAEINAIAAANRRGRMVFCTTTESGYVQNTFYFSNGTDWVAIATGGDASALQAEVDAIEATLGAAINSDGTHNAAAWNSDVVTIVGSTPTSWTQVINAVASYATSNDTLGELNDVTLTSPVANDLLQYNGTIWVNRAIGTASGVQGYDAGLQALATGGTGIVAMDGDNVYFRSLVPPAEGIAITNANGVAGAPTFALANDLLAIENLAATGFAARTAADTWANRTLTTASSTRITIANPAGVAGDPEFDLATVTDSGTGTFLKFTRDTYGRVTGTTPVVVGDITALVDAVYVNASGDTMTGNLDMGTNYVTMTNAPTADTHGANKAYVDAVAAGLSWKQAVRVATVANIPGFDAGVITIPNNNATYFPNAGDPAVIDQIELVNGNRVLVKDQTNDEENGIYVVTNAGEEGVTDAVLTRASDMNSVEEFAGAAVFVTEGNVNADSGWTQTAEVVTVNTSPVVWSQFSGSAVYTWGVGLSHTGNTINVNLGAGIYELPTDEVGIHLHTPTAGALILTTDGTTRSTVSAAALHLLLDGSTLTQGTGGLKVAAAGITGVELNSSVAGNGLSGGAGSPLEVNVDDATIEIDADSLRVKDGGITNAKIAVGTITNNRLVNSSITMAADAGTPDPVSLGETFTLIGGAGIATTVGANQVTIDFDGSLTTLSDVTVTGAAAGDMLVHNGTVFVNRKVYFLYDGASATSHVVTHGLGQRYCNVTVIDATTDEVIIPQSIVFDSASQLTVTLTAALAIKVVVMGVNSGA